LDDPLDNRGFRRTSVQEDWVAWLPEEKDRLFDAILNEFEISYSILSVTLNDAFNSCRQGKLAFARDQARIFGELFERLAARIRAVLRCLYEHGRQFGTFANTAPLRPGFFRSERAQQVARSNSVMALIRFRARTRFFRKLGALEEIVAGLQREAREKAQEIAEGTAVGWRKQWTCLEILDYDLNTSLRETEIVLKSFLCALPIAELPAFRQRAMSLSPKSSHPNRRPAPVVPKLEPTSRKTAAQAPADLATPTHGSHRSEARPTVLDNNK
jgi:hypothetical protein